MKKITIALIEDSITDMGNLKSIFIKSNLVDVKYTFLNGYDFLVFLENHAIDIDAAVIDYRMPVFDGLHTFRTLYNKKVNFKTLLVSHGYYSDVMGNVMSMGNQNYIQKNGDLILDVLPRILAGKEVYEDPTIIHHWDAQTKAKSLELKDGSEVDKLSPLYKKIIRLTCFGLSSFQIGIILGYETSSIEKYRGLILRELGLKNSQQLTAWAFSNALVTSSFLFQANQEVTNENCLQADEIALLKLFKAHHFLALENPKRTKNK